MSFGVHLRDRAMAETALQDHSADLAIVLEPVNLSVFFIAFSTSQPVWCLMREDHPLAKKDKIRLADCSQFPVALPEPNYGVRHLMDRTLMSAAFRMNLVIESDSFEFLRNLAKYEDVLTFHIPISLPVVPAAGLVYRPLDRRDIDLGQLSVGYLKGRHLPVAAASFLEQICSVLKDRFGEKV